LEWEEGMEEADWGIVKHFNKGECWGDSGRMDVGLVLGQKNCYYFRQVGPEDKIFYE